MMTDEQFIASVHHELVDYKPRYRYVKALPVGDYLIIIAGQAGYVLYNKSLREPIIEKEFESLRFAHKFAKLLIECYGEYLIMLTDKEWAKIFFWVVRWTVEYGHRMLAIIEKMNKTNGLIVDAR